ncbi:MAG: roadblock/LC7 domain-containing protein [Planctomycetota bacterium]|jgi:predicted regulator of Ras-like GTPase activity (Roadblock/LC7/MglB family)
MKDDASKKIREKRLVFYSEDVDRIDKYLLEFLKLSKARCSLLIDKEGHMVTRVGETANLDLDTISALVAGSYAATKEMARVLGEVEFADLFHQGKKESIQLLLVGDRTLLTVIFDTSTTVGMVRLYAKELTKKLTQLFQKAAERKPKKTERIGKDFEASAKSKLDDLFGE